ncbi:hypothetical protein VVD49_06485 [Uliginosibacterium sp. H3]|uniref:Uncharacterized protein n=1 Tax=Uliginosibacterium silvisoli TaxID=3114758 RepID=A0ABU6K2R2_9RHOO|nr:hypothetical protein [Uliginosibacterium sp. H3]
MPDSPSRVTRPVGRIAAVWRWLGRHGGQRVLLALLGVAVALTAAAHFLEREWAAWIGQRAPTSWVQAASIQTLQRLDASVLQPSTLSAETQSSILTRFASLRVPEGDAPLYELVFRRGGAMGARSFTLAGGQIVVTDEWVAQFADSRALLSALSVQLGHLQNHDALRSSVDHAPLRMLLAIFRGDAETGTHIMSVNQPVLEHDAHCEQEARDFAQAVMRANP